MNFHPGFYCVILLPPTQTVIAGMSGKPKVQINPNFGLSIEPVE